MVVQMTLVFPRFRQYLFFLTNMADRESSSENNTRSRSVQDFVRTVLHAVTNLQTQSGNPNRVENSSSAEFSSAEEEINARFQIPRHRRGIPQCSFALLHFPVAYQRRKKSFDVGQPNTCTLHNAFQTCVVHLM